MSKLQDSLEHAAELLLLTAQAVEGGLASRVREQIAGPSYSHAGIGRGEVPDPTFDAVVRHDQAREDLDRLHEDAYVVLRLARDLLGLAERYDAVSRPQEGCRSCVRDGGWLEEVTLRGDGTPYYEGLCRWCGAWKGEHGSLPPVPILRARHKGERITSELVRRHAS